MPCYDPERQEVVTMLDDDACYAPSDPMPMCPIYPMESIGGGDGHWPFEGLYDPPGVREEVIGKRDLTMVDPEDGSPRMRHGAVTGYRDLPGMVDEAIHGVGPECIHKLAIVDERSARLGGGGAEGDAPAGGALRAVGWRAGEGGCRRRAPVEVASKSAWTFSML
jgi:hypothetical protein